MASQLTECPQWFLFFQLISKFLSFSFRFLASRIVRLFLKDRYECPILEWRMITRQLEEQFVREIQTINVH